ncbi:ABC transporter ATP-binding protein [Polynucleobacter sp. AP-Sanab-80-C2]|uniref:ABC transporter ATP-binding protein n=1 Tax=unclassified Polynucleobacter TaxID=2640945 RepID=UPI001BFD3DAC|nr:MULTISPECIES: ABC transporter ATP-binding protein [unclassified Polynucleobacter]MEA9599752.1 ABC transporter ATP-binding protein [Polynucleobacter sp. AP-Sanab-80-C2]QWD69569.1 ABC transporter ATP-binding protein [Polynucleobacter sp. UB-Siik-W21]
MNKSEAILKANNLSKRFGGLVAVDNISFEVVPFGVTSIIGPNGAGKSTLFNLLSGTFRPDSGSVLLNDQNVTGMNPEERLFSGMARSFQITNLFFDLTVIDNLRLASQTLHPRSYLYLPLSKCELALARADELLVEFGLLDSRNQLAGALSHGQQRRLEIAVTLATRPKLLLLDEPTQGMSQGDTQETAELIKQLGSKITVLLIEHDVDLVMDLSKTVIVMAQGKKLAEGSPQEVRSNPLVQAAYFGEETA